MALLNASVISLSTIITVLITLPAGLLVNFLFRLYRHRQMMNGLVSLSIFCLHAYH